MIIRLACQKSFLKMGTCKTRVQWMGLQGSLSNMIIIIIILTAHSRVVSSVVNACSNTINKNEKLIIIDQQLDSYACVCRIGPH